MKEGEKEEHASPWAMGKDIRKVQSTQARGSRVGPTAVRSGLATGPCDHTGLRLSRPRLLLEADGRPFFLLEQSQMQMSVNSLSHLHLKDTKLSRDSWGKSSGLAGRRSREAEN